MGLPFLNSRAKRRDQIVAIDLGSRVTKAVHIQRRNEKFSLVDYALVDAPANDQSVSVESLSNHLKEVMKGLTSQSKHVSLAIGVSDCVFKHIELPLMPVGDMRQMLKFNAKNYLQQDLPDHVFDCCYILQKSQAKAPEGGKAPAGGTTFRSAQKQKVVIGGAPRQVIDEFASAIKSAGFLPEQIVPGIVGPLNAFELAEAEAFSKEVVAVVEIGFNHSTITILDGGELMLNRVVAIGGNRLTDTVAEAMGITYAEAEGIKVGMPAEANLESALHPLGRELRASLDFFETQHDKTVGTVFISGGSARSEFIVETLQNELMVPCKSWNPSSFMEIALEPEKLGQIEQVIPQLSVAIGTALAAL